MGWLRKVAKKRFLYNLLCFFLTNLVIFVIIYLNLAVMKRIVNKRVLCFVFFALLLGINLSRRLYAGNIEIIVLTTVSLAVVVACAICYRKVLLPVAIILAFFVGNGLFFLSYDISSGAEYSGQVAVSGRVNDKITDHGSYYSVILQDVSVEGEGAGNVLVNIYKTDSNFSLESGKELAFTSEIDKVHMFEFDSFNTYYHRNNIDYTSFVTSDNVTVVDSYLKVDESYRLMIKARLEENMSSESASICYAVLFGDQSEIPDDVKDAYRESGIIHILTVSGLHVGFLIGILFLPMKFSRAGKYLNFSISFILLLVYCFLCGFTPSVVRSALMGMIMLLAKMSGKNYDNLTSLSVAGLIIILTNPLSALDVGFLMSTFCVFAIFLLYSPFAKALSHVIPHKIATYIAVSLAAQIGILPFIASFSQNLNFLSVFANLIVVPAFGIVYPLLFLAMILVTIMPFISPMLVIFDYAFSAINAVAFFFASSPLKVKLVPWKTTVICLYFLAMAVLSRFVMFETLFKMFSFSIIFVLAITSHILLTLPSSDQSIDVVNFAYEQSAILTSSSGQTLLLGEIDDGDIERYGFVTNKKEIDYYATDTNRTAEEITYLESLSLKGGVTPAGVDGKGNILPVSYNQNIVLGDFTINYLMYDNIFAGIEVTFDNQKIFFASSQVLSYNRVVTLSHYLEGQDYDLAILRDNFRLLSCFDDCVAVTYDKQGGCDYSFEEQGNMSFGYGEQIYLKGSLD